MRYISLLRGINVAGKHKINMLDLKALYHDMGLEDVLSYIQSGNVLFSSDKESSILEEEIATKIKNTYGFNVPVQVRTDKEFQEIVRCCPFSELDLKAEATRVLVTFLEVVPSTENVQKLMGYVKAPERLVIENQTIYLYCPHGYGKSKLNNNFIENKLSMSATTRNWKSVCKLLELSRV